MEVSEARVWSVVTDSEMCPQELGSKETVVISDEYINSIAVLETMRTGPRWKLLSDKRNLYSSLRKLLLDCS